MINWGTWDLMASLDTSDYINDINMVSRKQKWDHYNWLMKLGLEETAIITHVQFLVGGLGSKDFLGKKLFKI